jgi:RNA polymerase sigma-70 factor (ECF subfamily)
MVGQDGHTSADAAAATRRARFAALIGAHGSVLETVARMSCRERAAAADLVQDTLERAWRHFDSLHDEGCACAWLVRIMRNAWLDQLRRRRAEVPLEDADEPPAAAADEPAWWELLSLEDVRQIIEQLEEPYRSIVILRDVQGRSYREIARLLEIPTATAATRLHRARRQVRALLMRKHGAAAPGHAGARRRRTPNRRSLRSAMRACACAEAIHASRNHQIPSTEIQP